MQNFNLNSQEASKTPENGRTSGFPSPAADYLAVNIDLNELLIPNPASHIKAWLHLDEKKYLVIIDRALPLKDGCKVIVWENEQWCLKIYRISSKEIWLYSVKNKTAPIKLEQNEVHTLLGRVAKLILMNP
jgi:DNA polymerase V|nr:hypothetical protein [uncultured Pedobacter sp.]